SQTMPNWKTYFMPEGRRPASVAGGLNPDSQAYLHHGQFDQGNLGVLLIDAGQHAVVLVEEHPRAQELEEIEVAGTDRGAVVGGAHGELVLDAGLRIAVRDRLGGEGGHARGVDLS